MKRTDYGFQTSIVRAWK